MANDKQEMIQLLVKCGIELNIDQSERLWKYHNLIFIKNQEYNLTAISDFKESVLKHYVDCLIIQKFTDIPFPLLDIGSGAGFPGILLKILYPKEKIIIAEPRKQRVKFLMEAKEALQLENTVIYPKKINHSYSHKVKAVITRALEPISSTLKRVSFCLETEGLAIFMKGPSVDKELKPFKRLFSNEYIIVKNKNYSLPLINHKRRLVVIKRENNSSAQATGKLPLQS